LDLLPLPVPPLSVPALAIFDDIEVDLAYLLGID
jgi:hypothetical protein